jgi:hypothetical protein
MSGYPRKLLSLELALKTVIRELRDEGIKSATSKSESHFRKCSDEQDKDHNIHHMDSVRLDLECRRRKLGNPMLEAHESMLEAADLKLGKFDNTSNTLIDISAKIGRLMETTKNAISKESAGGTKFTKNEKNKISIAIDEVEKKILILKQIIDSN